MGKPAKTRAGYGLTPLPPFRTFPSTDRVRPVGEGEASAPLDRQLTGGPLSRSDGTESPERAAASAKAFSGSLASGDSVVLCAATHLRGGPLHTGSATSILCAFVPLQSGRLHTPRGIDMSRKRITAASCHPGSGGLPCPPRRRGNPTAARAKRRGGARVSPRLWSGTRGHRETEGIGDVRKTGRGSLGIVERSPDGGSHDLQDLSGDGEARSSDRILPEASATGKKLHPELGPRPDTEWRESREG
jgi:hypothetical protein